MLDGTDADGSLGGKRSVMSIGSQRNTLRRELADLPIHWKDETLSITASFGASMAPRA
jgi:hypothetical protein